MLSSTSTAIVKDTLQHPFKNDNAKLMLTNCFRERENP